MTLHVTVYRRGAETFYRISPTSGRLGGCTIEAESPEDLDQWLDANGFLPLVAAG
jgi:hypothetical protein